MVVTLEKSAIVFTLKHDSINLKPLLHFIDNSFNKVQNLSDAIVILNDDSEEIKKKYLLKWAYKLYKKNNQYVDNIFYKNLITSFKMPIYVQTTHTKSIAQMAVITINQTDSFKISVTCNQYHYIIIKYFKFIFKDDMVLGLNKTTFNITIKTKSNLLLLKKILSNKEILKIPVTFITHGLNFTRLHQNDKNTDEYIYEEKLRKSYKILSISNNTTVKEIKKNYKNMLKKYHPDIVYNQNNSLVELYTKRFQVIQYAYELVKEHHKIA